MSRFLNEMPASLPLRFYVFRIVLQLAAMR